MIKEGRIVDPNYFIDEKGKLKYKRVGESEDNNSERPKKKRSLSTKSQNEDEERESPKQTKRKKSLKNDESTEEIRELQVVTDLLSFLTATKAQVQEMETLKKELARLKEWKA